MLQKLIMKSRLDGNFGMIQEKAPQLAKHIWRKMNGKRLIMWAKLWQLLGLRLEALDMPKLEDAFEERCREADGDADELFKLAAARAYLARYIDPDLQSGGGS